MTGHDQVAKDIVKALGLDNVVSLRIDIAHGRPIQVKAVFFPTDEQIESLAYITRDYQLVSSDAECRKDGCFCKTDDAPVCP